MPPPGVSFPRIKPTERRAELSLRKIAGILKTACELPGPDVPDANRTYYVSQSWEQRSSPVFPKHFELGFFHSTIEFYSYN